MNKEKYVVLNVWPGTHRRVMALVRPKNRRLEQGEHTNESADWVINRLLDVYEEVEE